MSQEKKIKRNPFKQNLLKQPFRNQDNGSSSNISQTTQISMSDPPNIFLQNQFIGIKENGKQTFENTIFKKIKQKRQKVEFTTLLQKNKHMNNSSSQMIERIRKSSFYQIQDMSSTIIRQQIKDSDFLFAKKQNSQIIKRQNNFFLKPQQKQNSNKSGKTQIIPPKFTNRSKIKYQKQERKLNKFHQNQVNLQKELYDKIYNSKQVLCYNCGGNHYSNDCKIDPSIINMTASGKIPKCLNCKNQGHSAKFCTQQKKCTICGLFGHYAKNCLSNNTIYHQRVCLNCHKKGHFTKECTQQRRCNLCLKPGHIVKDCPKNKRKLQNSCFTCQKFGHFANNCPELKKCFKCGSLQHYSKACNLKKNENQSVEVKVSQNKQDIESKKSELSFLHQKSKSLNQIIMQKKQKQQNKN